ncbi:MAG TPA: hypothetical protein VFD92_16385 [Candidatus Binatia bacterium]|nr:hypothetical protein [Candidatus Binatia bacterium]
MKKTSVHLVLAATVASWSALVGLRQDAVAEPESPFVVCEDQRYALCASAECFVYNLVAYCACDIERGDSISTRLSFDGPTGEHDVCDVNRVGRFNGYMVSTYSLPAGVTKGGTGAVYTCPGPENAHGGVAAPVAYAQCDGAICFTSSIARRFPGFPERLDLDEIICSCPISTSATPGSTTPLGYQMFGPYDPTAPPGQRCSDSGCAFCSVASPTGDGTTLRVGSPTGSADVLTLKLDGPPLPDLNRCECKCETAGDGTTSCSVVEP